MDMLVIGGGTHKVQYLSQDFTRLVAGENGVSYHQRTRIDEGIARDPFLMLKLKDGIERQAGWFPPDPMPEPVTQPTKCQGKRKDLGNRLDGERRICVPLGKAAVVGQG